MNKFYLLRHANTDRSKILAPSEYPLTRLGHEQAKKLVQVLNKLNIEKVFCSPYLRAKSTIDPYLKDSGLTVTYIEDLKGRQIGNTPKDEVWDFF